MISTLRESTAHIFVDSIDAPVISEFDAHHLLRVLRVTPRDAVTISNGRGQWRCCVLDANGLLETTSDIVLDSAPHWALTVAFAPVKGDRPEWTVQKLTEIGVDNIIPLGSTQRGVVRWEEGPANKHIERLRRIAREAAMQSRRTWLPVVHDVTQLSASFYVADPSGEPLDASHRAIAIGPEGGFTVEETLSSAGLVSLGETVLRAETAAVSAAVLMTMHRRNSHAQCEVITK